jgi:hypothetical protein
MMELVYISSDYIRRVGDYCGYIRPDRYLRDAVAEDTKVEGPTMAEVYYRLCANLARPPTQAEFVCAYEEANEGWFAANQPSLVDGMRVRVSRAWPSFLMEHHLFSLFVESGLVDAAYKNVAEDVSSGTDIKLRVSKSFRYIASFTDTRDGWAKAYRKQRKGKSVPAPCLYLPLNFRGEPRPIRCKGFHLYSPEHVEMALSMFVEMERRGYDYGTCLHHSLAVGLGKPSENVAPGDAGVTYRARVGGCIGLSP